LAASSSFPEEKIKEKKILLIVGKKSESLMKASIKCQIEMIERPGTSDSHLYSYLFGRLKSGGLRIEASPNKQFIRPHFQNNQRKMGWTHGSSSRAPALRV
jgi:hypothetical protein